MSVRPHPSKGEGWWIVDYYPSGRKGKRVRFSFEGKKGEALALEQEVRRAPGQVNALISPLVNDLISPWLEYYKTQVRPRTYEDAVDCLAHWLPYFGNFRPANITRSAINSYKIKQLKEIANKKAVSRGKPPRLILGSRNTVTRKQVKFTFS